MQLPDLTSAAIRTWLLTLPADEPCGTSEHPWGCVVANYLKAHLPFDCDVAVSEVEISIREAGAASWQHFDAPRNVARMISRFDRIGTLRPLPGDVLPLFKKTWRPT